MADKATILKNAQQFMSKGQIDKAIEQWQQLISESPNDGNIFNTIGDLFLKKNNLNSATEAYLKGAEVFRSAGFSLKSIAVYKKLIKLVPKRIDILVKLGDLNAERGLASNAISDFLAAAKHYSQEGKVREALEVYRKIADLDSSNTQVRLKLAEMCLKEGLKKEAVDEFVKLAEYFRQNNQATEADGILQRALKLAPDNEAVLRLMGKPIPEKEPPSLEERLRLIDENIQKGEIAEAQKRLEPILREFDDEPGVHQRMALVHIQGKNADLAFPSVETAVRLFNEIKEFGQSGKLLKDYLEVDPDRVEAQRLLGEVYERGGNPHLAVSAYAHVIDEFLASGEMEKAKVYYVKIKALEPGHRDVRRLRHSCETKEVATPSAISKEEALPVEAPEAIPLESAQEPAPESLMETPPEFQAEGTGNASEGEVPNTPSGNAPDPAWEEAEAPAHSEAYVDPAQLQGYFTEADVYLKYGLTVKAVEQLQQILSIDPDNTQAHDQLKSIYKSEGETDKALEECFILMDLYRKRGEPQARASVLEEAREINPEDPRIREAGDLAPILDSGRLEALLGEVEPRGESGPEADGDTQAEADADTQAEADPNQSQTLEEISIGGTPLESPEEADLLERLAEADFYYQQGLRDEAKKMYELILTLQPGHAVATAQLDRISQENAAEKQEREATAEREAASHFENTQPLYEDLSALSSRSSGEPSTDQSREAERSDVREEPEQEAARVAGESAGKSAGDFVDLTGMLSEDLNQLPELSGSGPASVGIPGSREATEQDLESLFSEYQKDAEEKEEEVDYETHYNLGIAYKEMGLLAEAIAEFEKAIHGPERFIDASNMLAGCLDENGLSSDAIGLLETALSDPRCDETHGLWLRYDLAGLYEKEGRREEALNAFSEVARTDSNFKDVADRIQQLEEALGRPGSSRPKEIPAEEVDEDIDTMMERIFGDSSPSGQAVPSKEEGKKKDRISYL